MGPRTEPAGELDTRYSSEGASPAEWPSALAQLETAEVFWISTVRPDRRPHVTPLIAVWLDDALWFCTGPSERKARNLARNPHCILTTGCNSLGEGVDLVVEGDAVRVVDDDKLRRIADAYESKYGEDWRFVVRDGAFVHAQNEEVVAHVFQVVPTKAFAFRKGGVFSQTRWRFVRA
jgi:nitroimidazol reductase NimA-like FMN-containing flavoprotein (pyridoxamine 5'-phosphate oxidase superfamily)